MDQKPNYNGQPGMDQMGGQNKSYGSCGCGKCWGGWGGNRALRILIGLIILGAVFCAGSMFGRLHGEFHRERGFYDRGGYPMPLNQGYGPMMPDDAYPVTSGSGMMHGYAVPGTYAAQGQTTTTSK